MSGLETIFLKAKRAESRGDNAEARRLLEDVLSKYPNNKKAMGGIARLDDPAAAAQSGNFQATLAQMLLAYKQDDFATAVALGEPLVRRFPQAANAANLLGAAYLSMDDMPGAESAFRRSLAADATHQPSHNNLGLVLMRQGQLTDAETSFRTAIRLNPRDVEARFNIATLLREMGRKDDAAAAYAAVLDINPDHVDARLWLGNVHRSTNDHMAAIDNYLKALSVKPDHFPSIFGMGHALYEMGHYDSAADVYHQATLVDPEHLKAHIRLGGVLKRLGDMDRARATYLRAVELKPESDYIKSQLLNHEANMALWTSRHDFKTFSLARQGTDDTIEPFLSLAFEDDPARQYERSRVHAEAILARPPLTHVFPDKAPGEKIRIGYFSADFHNHATLWLMAGMLREHDREKFEIRAYSFGTSSGGMRDTIMPYVDSFTDIQAMTDEDAVALARADRLDIAVDLKGYTRDARMNLFADRMAPVQIGYIGYPGTIGADFLDYIIGDPVVIPAGAEGHYSERVIRLPGTYQANDVQRIVGTAPDDRTRLGLPKDGFVFCCFNQAYKIGPEEYDIWMRLLHQVEGSVLWLFDDNDPARKNLHKEAEARGIDPARIIFAAKASNADHLARHRHADLFLDTFCYNAHTTASDALWMGVPIVTKAGRQFSARVAASVLTAIDMPDLITTTDADYEALALDLARSPEKLAAIKARLAANKLTTPLFDTVAHTRAIEAAYEAAHQRRVDGLAPDHISIG